MQSSSWLEMHVLAGHSERKYVYVTLWCACLEMDIIRLKVKAGVGGRGWWSHGQLHNRVQLLVQFTGYCKQQSWRESDSIWPPFWLDGSAGVVLPLPFEWVRYEHTVRAHTQTNCTQCEINLRCNYMFGINGAACVMAGGLDGTVLFWRRLSRRRDNTRCFNTWSRMQSILGIIGRNEVWLQFESIAEPSWAFDGRGCRWSGLDASLKHATISRFCNKWNA